MTGSVSWLYYADRLMEFPSGMLGVALGTIILPSLAKYHADANQEEYSRLLDAHELDPAPVGELVRSQGANIVIGSNQFIPGFEEQLVGVKAGDEKVLEVSFPQEYQAAHLAGKTATFDIKVKAIKAEAESKVDDDFAKRIGLESLDKLKELLSQNLNLPLLQSPSHRS